MKTIIDPKTCGHFLYFCSWPNTRSLINLTKGIKHFGLCHTAAQCSARYNALDIQMLSKPLHEQIFGRHKNEYCQDQIDKSVDHLSKHNLYGRPKTVIPDVDFKLPALRGSNIEEHFHIIAKEQTSSYFEMAKRISRAILPPKPIKWSYNPGWTQYSCNGNEVVGTPVDCPDGDVMVFDVEVCVNEGQFPTLATLVTPDHWYVSQSTIIKDGSLWILPEPYWF